MKQRSSGVETRLENTISYIFITGVTLSVLLEIAGMILYCRQNGNFLISADTGVFLRGNNYFFLIYELATGKFTNIPAIALMASGLAVLILTPFIRVLASVILFGWEKDYKYVWIAFLVFVIITLSLALH
jgi:uncharacterized membrane protein